MDSSNNPEDQSSIFSNGQNPAQVGFANFAFNLNNLNLKSTNFVPNQKPEVELAKPFLPNPSFNINAVAFQPTVPIVPLPPLETKAKKRKNKKKKNMNKDKEGEKKDEASAADDKADGSEPKKEEAKAEKAKEGQDAQKTNKYKAKTGDKPAETTKKSDDKK